MIVMQRRFSDIVLRETEICPTLEAGGGEGGNNLPMIVETFGFKPGQGSAAQGLGYEKEVAPTLNTSSSCGGGVLVKTKTYALGVAENCQESDVCSTLRVKEPYGGQKP